MHCCLYRSELKQYVSPLPHCILLRVQTWHCLDNDFSFSPWLLLNSFFFFILPSFPALVLIFSKIFFIYLARRETETEAERSSHLLVHSPNVHSSYDWAGLKLGDGMGLALWHNG